jgi:hypothetical protein
MKTKGDLKNKRSYWDWLKYCSRAASIDICKKASREKRAERQRLEGLYATQLREANEEAVDSAARLEKYYEEEDAAIRFRSKVESAESNEKISPFFFNQIKQNQKKSNVEKLVTDKYPNGTNTREQTMDALQEHFSKTFDDPTPTVDVPEHWWDGLDKIDDSTKDKLDAPITLNELTTALFKEMAPNKSPGSDGITVLFLRHFWGFLSTPYMDCVNEAMAAGELSLTQKESVVRLIPKKGKDPTLIKSLRPISLMNVDAKLIAKVLANRLKVVCKQVIGEEQLAYVEKRSIHDGHVLINKVLEQYRSKMLTGLMACIDFSGAFDSIKHDFIWKSLERFNVGPQLIKYLKILYFDARSAVMNFGTTTGFFKLLRSCRQGDPVAALLFILVLEVLLNKLRLTVTPLVGETFSVRSSTYAEDMTPFARNAFDLKRIISTINAFSPLDGLSINMDKSEVLELGMSAEGVGLRIAEEVTITGMTFSKDGEAMRSKNWGRVRDKAKRLFNAWSGRRLTIIGKANIIRAQIQPLVIFAGSTSIMPRNIEKELVTAQSRFLWHGNDKEKRLLMHKSLEDGGLNIHHWRSRLAGLHSKWISRMQEGSGAFRQVFRFNDINWEDPRSFVTQFPKRTGDSFAEACLNAWLDNLKLLQPSMDSLLWPILKGDLQTRVRRQCPRTSLLEALQATPPELNFLDRFRVSSEIRAYLNEEDNLRGKAAQDLRRDRFKDVNPLARTAVTETRWTDKISELQAKYEGKTLKDMDQRAMYWLSVDQILPRPSPFRERVEARHLVDWKWTDGLKLFTESHMQAFYWRSTHGKLYGRSNLFRFNYVDDPRCNMCSAEKQNAEHIFRACPRIQILFKNFEKHLKLAIPMSVMEKLIGVDKNSCRDQITNKKIGVLRKCVYDAVHAQHIPKWETVLKSIDNLYVTEYAIAEKNGRVHKVLKEWNL